TSRDGLEFTREPDLQIDDPRRWLGKAQSGTEGIFFFGTSDRGGVWMATSQDGQRWIVDSKFPVVPGADPGAVKLKDGGWLLAVTGPPRDRPRPTPITGTDRRASVPPLMKALDANGDNVIDD